MAVTAFLGGAFMLRLRHAFPCFKIPILKLFPNVLGYCISDGRSPIRSHRRKWMNANLKFRPTLMHDRERA